MMNKCQKSAQLANNECDVILSEHHTKRVQPSHHEGLGFGDLVPKCLGHQLPDQPLDPCLPFRQWHVVPSWMSRL